MVVRIIISEGPHDAAFLARVLLANGFDNSKKIIKDYPRYISGYLEKLLDVSGFDEFSIKTLNSHYDFPHAALCKRDSLDDVVILFTMNGDSQVVRRINLIRGIYETFTSSLIRDKFVGDTIKFIYNCDADEKGIDARLTEITEELRSVIADDFPQMGQQKWVVYNQVYFGATIFSDDTGKGKLENLVLPLMKKDKEDYFSEVNHFVACHEGKEMFKGRYSQYERAKALISIMSQFHISGVNNTVQIEKSCLINNQHILDNPSCKQLFDFIVG